MGTAPPTLIFISEALRSMYYVLASLSLHFWRCILFYASHSVHFLWCIFFYASCSIRPRTSWYLDPINFFEPILSHHMHILWICCYAFGSIQSLSMHFISSNSSHPIEFILYKYIFAFFSFCFCFLHIL